jgi:hypothetical protein
MIRRGLCPSGFATHVLALAKPQSMSRGRVYDMREDKVGLWHTTDDCLN